MNIADRIARQRAMMAERASVKPVPLKRDPRRPRTPGRRGVQQVIDAFIEDRAYDIVRQDRNRKADGDVIAVVNRDTVHSMADIFAILTKEQPDEYVQVSNDCGKSKSWREAAMDDIEAPDSSARTDTSLVINSEDDVAKETAPSPKNVIRLVAESSEPVKTAARPFSPPTEEHADDVAPGGAQATMLAAMRGQRKKLLEGMTE